jgi:hypothetical protein
MAILKTGHYPAKEVRETWDYRLMFVASFPIFLVAEIFERCATGHSRSPSKNGDREPSLFRAAKEAAHRSLPYAFMG